jgi:hypothetical protein
MKPHLDGAAVHNAKCPRINANTFEMFSNGFQNIDLSSAAAVERRRNGDSRQFDKVPKRRRLRTILGWMGCDSRKIYQANYFGIDVIVPFSVSRVAAIFNKTPLFALWIPCQGFKLVIDYISRFVHIYYSKTIGRSVDYKVTIVVPAGGVQIQWTESKVFMSHLRFDIFEVNINRVTAIMTHPKRTGVTPG